jgi:hypothetical protein
MNHLGLAPHVHICLCDGYIVLLDLKKDRYQLLDAEIGAGLGEWIEGWPALQATVASSIQYEPEEPDLLKLFREQGWLAEMRAGGKPASPVTLSMPTSDISSQSAALGPARATLGLLQLLWSAARGAVSLRAHALSETVERLGRRECDREIPSINLERAVETYTRLRAFVFSTRERCLYDSLVMLHFLKWYGVRPRWVFGVRTKPFAAHCWLQYKNVVLNDTVEHACSFTPVMIV